MATTSVQIHVLVSGILECMVCRAWVHFRRWALELDGLEDTHCPRCKASMLLIEDSLTIVPVVRLPGNRPSSIDGDYPANRSNLPHQRSA